MTAFTGDIQILLYTEEVDFSACRDFYQTLLCQAHDRKAGPVIVNLETEDVDQTYRELTAAEGIRIVSKPVTQSYGTRYFAVEDPCGNRINLYHSNH